jgi:hypothetical protein
MSEVQEVFMFQVERRGLPVTLALVLIIGLVGVHETFAQNGPITNPGLQPLVVIPNVDVPNPYPDVTISPFGNPFQPNVVQPPNPLTPSVNPNAKGDTDPNGNPYRNLNPNPITNSNVVTPSVTRYAIITVPNQ